MNVELATYPTEFRVAVRHASAVRRVTENVIVRMVDGDGVVGLGEGCPRTYVTGESRATALRFLGEHAGTIAAAADRDLDELRDWIRTNKSLIDANPAAFCAAELAALDVLARRVGQPVEELLGHPRLAGSFRYTAVLGDNPWLLYNLLLQRYLFRGFVDFKLKLSGDLSRDRAKVRRLRGPGRRVRVDANNLWSEPGPCIDHLKALDCRFFGIEEPLAADDLDGFAEIAAALETPIILDESGLRADQISALPGEGSTWIVNCRVSKMGGVIRTMQAVDAAVEREIGVVVGAQVGETSILSRAALPVAAAAGSSLLGQEGAFGTHLLAEDLTDPVIQFARDGSLTVGAQVDPDAPGWGLTQASEVEPLD